MYKKIYFVILHILALFGLFLILFWLIQAFTDDCQNLSGVSISSPDGSKKAQGFYSYCESEPNVLRVQLFVGEDMNEAYEVFSSVWNTSEHIEIIWESPTELVIIYPNVIKPTSRAGAVGGVRITYERKNN